MKITIALFGICVLAVTAGCQKSGDHSATPSSAKVTYISTLGDITYQGEKLNTIGAYSLLYDGNQRLVRLRREISHTTYNNLAKYSFLWANGHIAASNLDTLVPAVIPDRNMLPWIPEESMYSDSLIDTPYSMYFYTGERLDSVLYLVNIGDNSPQKVIYEYGPHGNITKETTIYFPTAAPLVYLARTITRYRYDQHPSPWNVLFKSAGMVLPFLFEGHNISKNNLIEIDVRATRYQSTFHFHVSKTYKYNSQGYSTLEITSGLMSDTILYRYN